MPSSQHPLSITASLASSAGAQSSPASTTMALSMPGPPATMTRAPGSRYQQQDWNASTESSPSSHGWSCSAAAYAISLLLVASVEPNCCIKLPPRGILGCAWRREVHWRKVGHGLMIPLALPTLGCKAGGMEGFLPKGVPAPWAAPFFVPVPTLPPRLGDPGGCKDCVQAILTAPLSSSSPPHRPTCCGRCG